MQDQKHLLDAADRHLPQGFGASSEARCFDEGGAPGQAPEVEVATHDRVHFRVQSRDGSARTQATDAPGGSLPR